MGELHLEILVDRMKREFKVEADVGAPQVAYRETITKDVEVDYTHKKQSGGAGQFARVKMKFKPLERNSGIKFNNTVVGGNIPKEYIPGVEKGINSAAQNGVIAGYNVIDFEAEVYDGAYHDVDSSVLAFEIDNVVSCNNSILCSTINALFNSWNIFFWNISSNNCIIKFNTRRLYGRHYR